MNARLSLCFMLATMLGLAGPFTGMGQETDAHKNSRREIEKLWASALAAQQRGDLDEARLLKRQAGELIVAERARLKELAAGVSKYQESLERITEKLSAASQQESDAARKHVKIDSDGADPAVQHGANADDSEPAGELKRDLQEKIENLKMAEKHLRRAGQDELATRVRGQIEKVARMRSAIEKDDRSAARRLEDIVRQTPLAKQPAEKARDARVEAKPAEAGRQIDAAADDAIKSLRQELENLRAEVKELRAAIKMNRQ